MVRSMTAQVAEGVTKGLLSVIKSMDAGNRVVFEGGYGFIENKKTKHKKWLEAKEGLYVIDPDVAPTDEPGFARQA